MADKIFLSYRRYDTAGTTGRLSDYLENIFGDKKVFKDVSDIPAGVDFRKVLGKEILDSKIVLVMIGQHYTSVKNEEGNPRLFDPNDFVRIEVETAINMNKIVIPVLVNGATMPRADELPDELKGLVNFNAVIISHDRFKSDVNVLVDKIKYHYKTEEKPPKPIQSRPLRRSQPIPPTPKPNKQKSWMLPATLGILATLVVLIVIGLMMPDEEPSPPVKKGEFVSRYVYVDTDELNVRNAPGTEASNVVGKVMEGEKLKVVGEDFVGAVKWYSIESSRYRGWVSGRLVSETKPDNNKITYNKETTKSSISKSSKSKQTKPREPDPEPISSYDDYKEEAPLTYADLLIGSWDCYKNGNLYDNGNTLFTVTFYTNGQAYSSYNGVTYNYTIIGNLVTVLGDNVYEIFQMDQNNMSVRYLDAYGNLYVASYRRRS